MNDFLKSLKVTLQKPDSQYVLICSIIFFLFSILLVEKSPTILSIASLDFSLVEKVNLIFTYFIDLKSSFTLGSLVLIILGSVLSGINVAFAYVYFKSRAKVLVKTNLYSGAGLFFSLLGVGCAACGTALLSTILGFLGLSFVLGFLPYQGLEIGYLGLFILSLATMSLAKKVAGPKVC